MNHTDQAKTPPPRLGTIVTFGVAAIVAVAMLATFALVDRFAAPGAPGLRLQPWPVVALGAALCAALACGAALLARRLTAPMNKLSQLMAARAAGGVAADMPGLARHHGFREVQLLSQAMGEVLDAEVRHRRALQKMNEELEARLAERTAELHAMAMNDTLTGLPNRRALMHMLPQALKRAARLRRACAVLFLDLDGFKAINDSFGHEEGDELLRQVGARILASVRKTDMVARLAGDEFVVILEMLPAPADAEATANKILPHLRHPFALANNIVTVSSSIGVAVFMPDDAPDMAALLARADQAMHHAKGMGKNAIALAPPARETGIPALV